MSRIMDQFSAENAKSQSHSPGIRAQKSPEMGVKRYVANSLGLSIFENRTSRAAVNYPNYLDQVSNTG
jgi:hypothetical protein